MNPALVILALFLAISLALGLLKAGSKVGLLDTDVYGPSIPHLLGLEGVPPPAVVVRLAGTGT